MRRLLRSAFLTGGPAISTTLTTAAMASPPECLATNPINCTTGMLKLIRPIAIISIVFEYVCLTHDLCYRHGEATYGYAGSGLLRTGKAPGAAAIAIQREAQGEILS